MITDSSAFISLVRSALPEFRRELDPDQSGLSWVEDLDEQDEPPMISFEHQQSLLRGVADELQLPLLLALAVLELDRQVQAAKRDGLRPDRMALGVSFLEEESAEISATPHLFVFPKTQAPLWPPPFAPPSSEFGKTIAETFHWVRAGLDGFDGDAFVVLEEDLVEADKASDVSRRVVLGHLECSYYSAAKRSISYRRNFWEPPR